MFLKLRNNKTLVRDKFLAQVLERLEGSTSPCPCEQAILRRCSPNLCQNERNSTILVPLPDIYKYCELQNKTNFENDRETDNIDDKKLPFTGNINELQKLCSSDETIIQKNIQDNTSLISVENDAESEEQKQFRNLSFESRINDEVSEEISATSAKKSNRLGSFRRKCKAKSLPFLISNGSLRKAWSHTNSTSAKRVNRSQRIEKRATKTLGIVVGMKYMTMCCSLKNELFNTMCKNYTHILLGVFLACWVPFFSLYIVSAICIQLDIKSCQADFYAFFYTTWLGYINSCVNPIIYTIFNVEFRRAFKCILLCKLSNRKY
ncbi:unnamed protein product [Thelazia callipaeda]|uniref:G_PROTEIN_RECEP_F1_2 domain-containing protein n=1 Tax=Thelazia callipaeda TaxID=103827 RepID=A0A0N5DAU1_THECL|nr:unnamed protein product [Thelazia callipaeda]